MSLHLSLSTLCSGAANLRGWHSARTRVEFLFEGWYGSIEQGAAKIGNHLNKDAGSFPTVDSKAGRNSVFPQRDTGSGRYRRKRALPT